MTLNRSISAKTIPITEPNSPASYWFGQYSRMAAHADWLAEQNAKLARENADMRSKMRETQDGRHD